MAVMRFFILKLRTPEQAGQILFCETLTFGVSLSIE